MAHASRTLLKKWVAEHVASHSGPRVRGLSHITKRTTARVVLFVVRLVEKYFNEITNELNQWREILAVPYRHYLYQSE